MKVWVLVDFTGPSGQRYTKGSQLTLPNDTPEQQAYVSSLIRYGIVTTAKPATGATT
jgi:hypothetical protein